VVTNPDIHCSLQALCRFHAHGKTYRCRKKLLNIVSFLATPQGAGLLHRFSSASGAGKRIVRGKISPGRATKRPGTIVAMLSLRAQEPVKTQTRGFAMNLEAMELAQVTQDISRPGVRWSSVFAGICVGIAAYVLAMLSGICVGLVNGLIAGANASMTALAWNLLSALGAAVLGGFVTSRSADLRRAADGALHGLVVWAGAALLVILVALLLVRDVAGHAVLLMAQGASSDTSLAQVDRDVYGSNGWQTTAFSGPVVKSDTPLTTRANRGEWIEMSAPAHAAAEKKEIGISAYAALMMCAALAISFFGGIAGGLMGTRSAWRGDSLEHADWRTVRECF